MLNVSEIIIQQQKLKGGHLMQINVILDRQPAAIEADNNKKQHINSIIISSSSSCTMAGINFSRLLRGNVRSNTCRIVLATSLVWLIIDVILVVRYSDYMSDTTAKRSDEFDVLVIIIISNVLHEFF